MLFYILVTLFVLFTKNNAEPSTTVDEIELPGSKSTVKIFEDVSPWDDSDRRISKYPKRRASTDRQDTTFSDPSTEENFNQYALEKFLDTYAEKFRRKHYPSNMNTKYEDNEQSTDKNEASSSDKDEELKKWNLMRIREHKHPYEDKSGWVSLEPVPWSLSKISKWHSEKKPVKKPEMSYDAIEKPWEADLVTSEYNDVPSKPTWYQKPRPYKIKPASQYKPVQTNNYNEDEEIEQDNYYQMNRPTIVVQQPEYSEADSSYDHKVQIHYNMDPGYEGHKHFIKRPSHHTHRYDTKTHKNCHHDHSSEEIITDDQPSNFPNRRKSSEIPENHPFTGNGDWILLSTTKGYKSPKTRQRSLQITSSPMQTESTRKSIQIIPNSIATTQKDMNVKQGVQFSTGLDDREPDSVGFKKGVQLTVLPPLKSSKVNMTTSHGGLLQVESTFETVEQAQQRHARKVKGNFRKKPLRTTVGKKVIRRPAVQKLNVALPVTTLNDRMGRPDISAVLAAAGAGMIPATMAMLVPMAMGGKRRRRDTRHQYRTFLS
ncbi:uncharacterized protein LOC123684033 [Harmonia axyridis]|uniref:uncharacterized protein LOC123684033 n=1 Tax=Harmonia axyridis TaxID=115357 RepID=UPI001E277D18|nr:uncharacterized protein LOC123684033 [Harmonia axyridis]